MGTDIHAVIEYEDSRGFVTAFTEGEINLPRNYYLFAALAGVRSRNGEVPLVPPRGIPSKCSEAAHRLFFIEVIPDSEEHQSQHRGYDFFLKSEAEHYVKAGLSFYSEVRDEMTEWVSSPDRHTPSWLRYSELNSVLAKMGQTVAMQSAEFRSTVAAMEVLAKEYGPDRVRLVFCFDN